MKTTSNVKENQGKELKECLVLWNHTSKSGNMYLSGNLSEELGNGKIIGFYISNKKNPKEPDIRVYTVNDKGEQDTLVVSLWENISKNNTRYLSGITNENEKVVGFYGNEEEEKQPYLRLYFEN